MNSCRLSGEYAMPQNSTTQLARLPAMSYRQRQWCLFLLLPLVIVLLGIHAAQADEGTQQPVSVVELFTSHGCSSCPPADKLMGELIAQDDSLVAFEFHVDYWNQLIHGAAGNWVDPFSSKDYTDRQRSYNAQPLSGRPGVYTPQMIVNGEYAAVGSDRRRINRFLNKTTPPSEVLLKVDKESDQKLLVNIRNTEKIRTQLWLVVYDLHERTEITAGENKNVTIDNHHIVKSMNPIGRTISAEAGSEQEISVSVELAEGEGCSILAQSHLTGPVHGAVNCPRSL